MNSLKVLPRLNVRYVLAVLGGASVLCGLSVLGVFDVLSLKGGEFVCAAECSSREPVCGVNGIWYGNACLAKCASVGVTRHREVCENSFSVVSGSVSNSAPVLTLHADKGYTFVGYLPRSIGPAESRSQSEKGSGSVDALEVKGGLRRLSDESSNVKSTGLFSSAGVRDTFSAYLSSARSLASRSMDAVLRQAGDLWYRDFASKKDEMPGVWMVVEEDGAVYVRADGSAAKDSGFSSSERGLRGVDSGRSSITEEAFEREENEAAASNSEVTGNTGCWNSSSEINVNIRRFGANGAGVPPSQFSSPLPTPTATSFSSSTNRRQLAVIGEDSRWQITDSTQSPHRQVGELAPLGCTGTLVGPRHVISAAHCLWFRSQRGGGYLASDEFYAGRVSNNQYWMRSRVVRKVIHRQYKSMAQNEFNWDFGILELADPIGYELGWMGIENDCADRSLDLHVAGYPADKPLHTMWMSQCGRTQVGCGIRSIAHQCDTAPGMSGSSMWVKDPEDDKYKIRAVHVAGSSSINRATYIDREVFRNIVEWRGVGGVNDACPSVKPDFAKNKPPTPYVPAQAPLTTYATSSTSATRSRGSNNWSFSNRKQSPLDRQSATAATVTPVDEDDQVPQEEENEDMWGSNFDALTTATSLATVEDIQQISLNQQPTVDSINLLFATPVKETQAN